MSKAILIHANCNNPNAKGDFVFAGNIAKDLVHELQKNAVNDIEVILVSSLDGIPRFNTIYGPAVSGHVFVDGTKVGLCSLEEFDAVENTVVAFIDANRCKYSAAYFVKRVLAPDSKILFVDNVNQISYSDIRSWINYYNQIKFSQPGVYDFFDIDDIMIKSAGFGSDRLGLPTINKAEDLPLLSDSDQLILPTGAYGFGYLAAESPSQDYALIAQYFKLSGQKKQIIVGDFMSKQTEIEYAYLHDITLTTSNPLPQIQFYQYLPNVVIRHAMAHATGTLVLSTGVTSTLEAMRDNKLPYYQSMPQNIEFVNTYLIALKSIVSNDNSLVGIMPQIIMELAALLFTKKPLNQREMGRTHELLNIASVCQRLINSNQTILDQASGKIAPRLLSFLGKARNTKDQVQLTKVCASLQKPGELASPANEQALRRAASWGRLFELKVLIKSMKKSSINKADLIYKRTALHWAVIEKRYDCVRELINSDVSLNSQDIYGQTSMHLAAQNGDRAMIKILIEAGAAISIRDKTNNTPEDYSQDNRIFFLNNECQSNLHI